MFSLREHLRSKGGFNEYYCYNCGFTYFLGCDFTRYVCSVCNSKKLVFAPAGFLQILEKEESFTKEETHSLERIAKLDLPTEITVDEILNILNPRAS